MYENVSVSIFTTEGRQVNQAQYPSTERLQLETAKAAGYYMVEIRAEGRIARFGVLTQ
jgi:hypothetical protein